MSTILHILVSWQMIINWEIILIYFQVACYDETTGRRKVARKFFALAFLNPDRNEVQIENHIPSSDLVFVYNQLVIDLYGLESADLRPET